MYRTRAEGIPVDVIVHGAFWRLVEGCADDEQVMVEALFDV
jgi:hypothetical protein